MNWKGLHSMNARTSEDKFLFWMASCFFAVNFLNLIAWSLGFHVSPLVFGAAFLIFVLGSFLDLKKNWMVLAIVSCVIFIILGVPLTHWDARHIWFFHAKRIFVDNNLYTQLDNYFPESHNDYPVLVPAIAASFAKGLGFWNEIFPRLSILPVLIPIFLVLRILFKRHFSFAVAVLGTLFVSKQLLVDGYMDAILGLYIAVACLLLEKCEEKSEYSWLIWIFLALPMIKNEGVLALLLLLISFFFIFRHRKVLWLGPIATCFIYYFLWKRPVAISGIQTTDLFVSGILDRALKRLSSGSDLLEIFLSMVKVSGVYFVALWTVVGLSRKGLVPAFFTAFYTLAMYGVYLITTLDLHEHLSHSVDRVLLPVNLTILLTLVDALLERESKIQVR